MRHLLETVAQLDEHAAPEEVDVRDQEDAVNVGPSRIASPTRSSGGRVQDHEVSAVAQLVPDLDGQRRRVVTNSPGRGGSRPRWQYEQLTVSLVAIPVPVPVEELAVLHGVPSLR